MKLKNHKKVWKTGRKKEQPDSVHCTWVGEGEGPKMRWV